MVMYNKYMLRILYQIASEIILIFLYPVFSILVQFLPEKALKGNGKGKTIIIVERWLYLNIRHVYWKHYIEKKGFNSHLVNFPIRKGDFKKSAIDLGNYLERNHLENVVLVGISSGALTSLVYLQEMNGWERVDKFISIGTPFRGTWMALVISYLKSGRELLPKSGFIKKISNYTVLNPDKILCIRAEFDEMVPSGSILPDVCGIVMEVFGQIAVILNGSSVAASPINETNNLLYLVTGHDNWAYKKSRI